MGDRIAEVEPSTNLGQKSVRQPQTGDDLDEQRRYPDPFVSGLEPVQLRRGPVLQCPWQYRRGKDEMPARPDGGAQHVQYEHRRVHMYLNLQAGRGG